MHMRVHDHLGASLSPVIPSDLSSEASAKEEARAFAFFSRLLKNGVRRRCEPPQPLAVAGLLLLALFKREVFSAKGLSCVASCKRPDTTPASIFQQPVRPCEGRSLVASLAPSP